MGTFKAKSSALVVSPPNPSQHVNFQPGMVLGAADFDQEFAYLSGHDQWLARDLLGYGTVSGLLVRHEMDADKGPRLVIEPGTALSPRGQLIRVPAAQCAYLDDWLKLQEVKDKLLSVSPPSGTLTVYVVLCYRECMSSPVLIPGEPCRSEDNLMVESRRGDDFELKLSFEPPQQREENELRRFVHKLRQIEISETEPSVPLADFLDALRDSDRDDLEVGSPFGLAQINALDVCEYLQAAFRLWVTELRPRYQSQWSTTNCQCGGEAPATPPEECLLLAELRIPIRLPSGGGDWQVANPEGIEIDEENRPYLIHLRLLQEWLLCGKHGLAPAVLSPPPVPVIPSPPEGILLDGDVTGPEDDTTVKRLQRVPVSDTSPQHNQVLQFKDENNDGVGIWMPEHLELPLPSNALPISETSFSDAVVRPRPGTSLLYSRADHTHGIPADPIPPHVSDTTSHSSHQVGGDVTGTIGNAKVERLHNFPVNSPNALQDDGKVLKFRSSPDRWELENVTNGNPNAVEHPLERRKYQIVAAGRMLCIKTPDGQPNQNPYPVYNDLRVRDVTANTVTLTFNGYKETTEDGSFQCIVKVLPDITGFTIEEKSQLLTGVVVNVQAFFKEDRGFELRVFGLPKDTMKKLILLVEVSQYSKEHSQ